MKYDYRRVHQIEFTQDDIAVALVELSEADRYKEAARLNVDYTNGAAVRTFTHLADALGGNLKADYSGLTVLVRKSKTELTEAALHDLRYGSKHEVLRDLRAHESGVEPTED